MSWGRDNYVNLEKLFGRCGVVCVFVVIYLFIYFFFFWGEGGEGARVERVKPREESVLELTCFVFLCYRCIRI